MASPYLSLLQEMFYDSFMTPPNQSKLPLVLPNDMHSLRRDSDVCRSFLLKFISSSNTLLTYLGPWNVFTHFSHRWSFLPETEIIY